MDEANEHDRVRYIVFTWVPEERLEEWKTWHSTKHIPDVLATPQVRAARKYRVADNTFPGTWQPQYATVYELDSMADFQAYVDGPAAALRKDHDERYGDVIKIARMVLVEEERFQ